MQTICNRKSFESVKILITTILSAARTAVTYCQQNSSANSNFSKFSHRFHHKTISFLELDLDRTLFLIFNFM